MVKYRAVAVAVAVSGGGAVAVAVAVAGLTKRFFNHIQKDFLINVLNQDVRISIFNVIRTKWQGYEVTFSFSQKIAMILLMRQRLILSRVQQLHHR